MFVKVVSPDNTVVAVNSAHVRAIYQVTDRRCNLSFYGAEKTLAVNMGIDQVIDLLTPKPTSVRATRKTVSSE